MSITYSEATQRAVEVEGQAMQAAWDAADTYTKALAAIRESLPAAPGYLSEARSIIVGMEANLSFVMANQLPELIQRLSPSQAPSSSDPAT